MGDAAHILMWLVALLVSLFHSDLAFLPVTQGTVGLALLLVGLELRLALKRRQPRNVTSPVIKRFLCFLLSVLKMSDCQGMTSPMIKKFLCSVVVCLF